MRVLGVLAGEVIESHALAEWARGAEVLVAADGGANRLVEMGIVPDYAVGDFDSISEGAKSVARELVPVEDQEYSDCDKLLQFVQGKGWNAVTLIGAEGSRIDHMLGILRSAARAGIEVAIAYRRQFGRILRGPYQRTFELSGLFSLLPIDTCRGVTLRGVRWPLEGVEFGRGSMGSLSNEGLGTIEVTIDEGTAILLYDYDGKPIWTN